MRPMLASIGDTPLVSTAFVYEPKYDGIRALVAIEPARGGPSVRIWSRLGNDKTAQFPEVAEALRSWARTIRRPLLLDGEIVALGEGGEPVGFQHLQGRLHLKDGVRKAPPVQAEESRNAALVLFDILREGDTDLRGRALNERRSHLERVFARTAHARVRLSEQVRGDGRSLQARALVQGWEGLIAKSLDSPYKSGRRSPDWRKLKLVRTQTCVVGGWTDPRGTRPRFGALVLGVYDDQRQLRYVGHAGSGFSDAELERVFAADLEDYLLTDSDVDEAVKQAGPRHVVQLINFVTTRAAFDRITEAAGLQLE